MKKILKICKKTEMFEHCFSIQFLSYILVKAFDLIR